MVGGPHYRGICQASSTGLRVRTRRRDWRGISWMAVLGGGEQCNKVRKVFDFGRYLTFVHIKLLHSELSTCK